MTKKTKPAGVTTLTFQGVGGCAEIVVDQAVAITITGGALFAGGPVMANHANGAWHVGDQRLERISVRGPVRVEFRGKGRARAFGPFAEFSLVGDAAIAGGKTFARYEPAQGIWSFAAAESPADTLVIRGDPALTPG